MKINFDPKRAAIAYVTTYLATWGLVRALDWWFIKSLEKDLQQIRSQQP